MLDLGCGQGRDAIPLAESGYNTTGIDSSAIGIEQLIQLAQDKELNVTGRVGDIYQFEDFGPFDVVLLDSIFHFNQKDRQKESELLQKIFAGIKPSSLVVICIQDSGTKVTTLKDIIAQQSKCKLQKDTAFQYKFNQDNSNQLVKFNYRMIVVGSTI